MNRTHEPEGPLPSEQGGSPRKFLVVVLLIALVPFFFVSRTFFVSVAQIKDNRRKTVKKTFSPNEPVEIVSITARGKKVDLGEEFIQPTEWLRDLEIEIKNTSGQVIEFLVIDLLFPETTSTGNVMSFPLRYGRSTSTAGTLEAEQQAPIGPNRSITLSLDDNRLLRLQRFLETRHKVDSLTRLDIRILKVHFDNGRGWDSGIPTKRDPEGRFVPLNPDGLGGH
jgi:hypothetical protein